MNKEIFNDKYYFIGSNLGTFVENISGKNVFVLSISIFQTQSTTN
jgi:hypothetical protein